MAQPHFIRVLDEDGDTLLINLDKVYSIFCRPDGGATVYADFGQAEDGGDVFTAVSSFEAIALSLGTLI